MTEAVSRVQSRFLRVVLPLLAFARVWLRAVNTRESLGQRVITLELAQHLRWTQFVPSLTKQVLMLLLKNHL